MIDVCLSKRRELRGGAGEGGGGGGRGRRHVPALEGFVLVLDTRAGMKFVPKLYEVGYCPCDWRIPIAWDLVGFRNVRQKIVETKENDVARVGRLFPGGDGLRPGKNEQCLVLST